MNMMSSAAARGVAVLAACAVFGLIVWLPGARTRTKCASNLAEVFRAQLLFYAGNVPAPPGKLEEIPPEALQEYLIKYCGLRSKVKCPEGPLTGLRRVTAEDSNHPQPYCSFHNWYYTELKGVVPVPPGK